MSKDAAKAPWEVAIERLAATVAESIAKANAEAKARADEAAAEAKARDKKVAEETAELRRIMGISTTDEGEFLEYDVAAAIADAMELDGVKFDEVITNSHVHGKYGDGEFDWIGINGKVVFVGETRRTLDRRSVRHFANDRMELFRRAFSRYTAGKQVQSVLIYQKAKAGSVEEALKLNIKVFRAEDVKTLRPVKTPADIPKRTRTKTHKRPQKDAA